MIFALKRIKNLQKKWKMSKKQSLTSKSSALHLFAGQNIPKLAKTADFKAGRLPTYNRLKPAL